MSGFLISSDSSGSFTAGGDLAGSSSSQQVVTLTGSAGIITLPIGNILRSTGASNVGDIITTSAGSLVFGNQAAATNVSLYGSNIAQLFANAAAAQVSLLATGAGAMVRLVGETTRIIASDNSTEAFRFTPSTGIMLTAANSQIRPISGSLQFGDGSTTTYLGASGIGISVAAGVAVAVLYPSATGTFRIQTPQQVFATWSHTNAGAGSVAFDPAVTAVTIKQEDLTTNSGTGANFIIQAQNETGTTSIGGDIVLSPGTGTSTSGKVRFSTTRVAATGGSGPLIITNNSIGVAGGPATSTQDGWIPIKDSAGNVCYIPVWR